MNKELHIGITVYCGSWHGPSWQDGIDDRQSLRFLNLFANATNSDEKPLVVSVYFKK